MKLFEYQAKELFSESSIAVPPNTLIGEISELDSAVEKIGLPCVLKAQVLHGGRGKAGLVKLVQTKEEARNEAKRIMEATDKKLLVEGAVSYEREMYVSITVDAASGLAMVMACLEGGVDIEEIARTMPEKIIKEKVDMSLGLTPYQADNIMYSLGLEQSAAKEGSKLLLKLYQLFVNYNAELVEINPLMILKDGTMVAADGKFNLDDNALYKQNRFSLTRDHYKSDFEYEAALDGIPYIAFEGDIGMMVAGAGLANVVFDLIHYYGGTVANYLEFGGPNYHKAHKCMKMMLEAKPKCILIATFGTIARADVMAQGIVEAVKELKPEIPIVAVIRGTGEEEAQELLRSVGLTSLGDTEEAVKKAIEIVGGAEK
ncbi:succinate--CoA ligase subunit beta [Desulfitobacterium chlororespirans]|uniref:Succinyl-CoA synthetase beta subunit n=1 Tax=Desulfitobacterium chlororespirans DSM 11544 TaxID=1121395 RepID=A0A1M7UXE1_9FIRM|nr:ATP-grasp domain-containing protein [Desulfitobacterium chlororespirans]SHN87612.1 succinyl-CoA synthetase beta subunit [Desulfitobacterium chlororespirans DSM 11544]